MIIDSSALVAILQEEPESKEFSRAIHMSQVRLMSAASFVEVSIVIDEERNPISSRRLDSILSQLRIEIEPVTEAQARIAREAYRDFGKKSGHKAKLNFGDCFSYALARSKGEPLLFKGNDFIHTDVRPAVVLKKSH